MPPQPALLLRRRRMRGQCQQVPVHIRPLVPWGHLLRRSRAAAAALSPAAPLRQQHGARRVQQQRDCGRPPSV
eukprot:jgi/Mesen1/9922/ME000070S09205